MNPKSGGGNYMKRLVICAILLFAMSLVGCSSKDISITPEDVTNNTFVAKADGVIQVATVEDFDKDYYVLNELQEYVAGSINEFNKKADGNKVSIDAIEKKDNKAVMLLTYSGMDQYCGFNKVKGAYFTGGNKKINFTMPENLLSEEDGTKKNTLEVIKNEKYKVLVLFEPYDVIVDGKVMYHSENMLMVEENKVQSIDNQMSVVVYKP